MTKLPIMQATVKLHGFIQNKGGFELISDLTRRMQIPSSIQLNDIKTAQRDCELLGEKLKNNPKEAAALFQCILDNKLDEARSRSQQLGIDEKKFTENGGGFLWLVVIVILLYATDAF